MPKNISDFLPATTMGRAVEGVLVTPSKLVATDTFKLIEVKHENPIEKPVVLRLPKGMKTFDGITATGETVTLTKKGALYPAADTLDPDQYPRYEQAFPTEQPQFQITLSPVHLKAIATAYEKSKAVRLSFYSARKPLHFTDGTLGQEETKRALLMPIVE